VCLILPLIVTGKTFSLIGNFVKLYDSHNHAWSQDDTIHTTAAVGLSCWTLQYAPVNGSPHQVWPYENQVTNSIVTNGLLSPNSGADPSNFDIIEDAHSLITFYSTNGSEMTNAPVYVGPTINRYREDLVGAVQNAGSSTNPYIYGIDCPGPSTNAMRSYFTNSSYSGLGSIVVTETIQHTGVWGYPYGYNDGPTNAIVIFFTNTLSGTWSANATND